MDHMLSACDRQSLPAQTVLRNMLLALVNMQGYGLPSLLKLHRPALAPIVIYLSTLATKASQAQLSHCVRFHALH